MVCNRINHIPKPYVVTHSLVPRLTPLGRSGDKVTSLAIIEQEPSKYEGKSNFLWYCLHQLDAPFPSYAS